MSKKISKFDQFVEEILKETTTAGGSSGAFGDVGDSLPNPNSPWSKDTYAPGDARNVFGFKHVQRRNFPEAINKKRKRKKKKVNSKNNVKKN